MGHVDPKWRDYLNREMAQVGGHNAISMPCNRGCQYVPVVGIGERKASDDMGLLLLRYLPVAGS